MGVVEVRVVKIGKAVSISTMPVGAPDEASRIDWTNEAKCKYQGR